MKLDKERSRKNIIVKDLENIEEKLTEVRLSNGRLCVSAIVLIISTFVVALDTVCNCLTKTPLDLKHLIIDIVLLGICCGVSMKMLSVLNKKQKEHDKLENDKRILLDELKNLIETNEKLKTTEKTKKLS